MKKSITLLWAVCAGMLLSGCAERYPEYDKVTLAMTYDKTGCFDSCRQLYVFDGGTVYFTDERDSSRSLEQQITDSFGICTDEWECPDEYAEIADIVGTFDFGSEEIAKAVKEADNGGWNLNLSVEYYALVEKDGESALVKLGERGMKKGEGNVSSDIDELERLCRIMDKMAESRPDELTTGGE